MYRRAQQDPSEMIWYLIYLPATFFVFIMLSVGVNDQLNGLNTVYDLDQVLFLAGVRYRLVEPDVVSQRSTWSKVEYSGVTQAVINRIGQSPAREIGVKLSLPGAACNQPPQFCAFSSDYAKNPSCASSMTRADCAFEKLRPLIQWKGSLQTARYVLWNTEAKTKATAQSAVNAEAVFAK